MSHRFKIGYPIKPKDGKGKELPLELPHRFVAAGITSSHEEGLEMEGSVIGILHNRVDPKKRHKDDPAIQYGITVRLQPKRKCRRAPGAERHPKPKTAWLWLIFFKPFFHDATPLNVDLVVYNLVGTELGRISDITIRPPAFGLSISEPPDTGGNYCPYGFVAYGEREPSESPIQAEVSLLAGDPIPADFIYEDTETDFWCAQFPVIADGDEYELAVTGAAQGTDTVYPISIREEHCA